MNIVITYSKFLSLFIGVIYGKLECCPLLKGALIPYYLHLYFYICFPWYLFKIFPKKHPNTFYRPCFKITSYYWDGLFSDLHYHFDIFTDYNLLRYISPSRLLYNSCSDISYKYLFNILSDTLSEILSNLLFKIFSNCFSDLISK